MWTVGDMRSFAPSASVEAVIEGLRKYKDSKDLTVAIHLNRGIKGFNPSEVKVPQLNIAALWIYGGISPDKSRWAIWGNFLDELQASEFSYPS